ELVDFIRQGEFARVVLLASSDAALRPDALIEGPQIRLLAVNWPDEELAGRLQELSLGLLGAPSAAKQEPLKQLHAAGAAKHLLRLLGDTSIPTVALVALVSEGDNVPDAIRLASAANALLEIAPGATGWRAPQSWQWLRGPADPPSELY
ncbi:Proteasome assembly chaperone 2, partial [Coemansia nantahalensis]